MNARLITAALTLAASQTGCLAILVPFTPGMAETHDRLTGEVGQFCLPFGARAGEKVTLPDGRKMVVRKVEGFSPMCSHLLRPNRADLVEDKENPT